MMRKNFTLLNKSGEIIRADLRYRSGTRKAPTIIICHGFKGFKDWGFYPLLAERLAEDGYTVINFNFSRNGIGADLQNFTEPEKFAKNTISHELQDLTLVIDQILDNKIGNGYIDGERIGLLGHSRGGGIALLHTAHDPRIKALVTWAAISSVHRYTDEQVKQFQEKGFIEIENLRTKQMMRLDKVILDDLKKNKSKLDILKAAAAITVPTLVIHGDQDMSVPVSEGQAIYDNLGCEVKNLEIIEAAGHTFQITHPMNTPSEYFDLAFDLTENWFDNYL